MKVEWKPFSLSNSLRPHELYSPWNSQGQNTGVGSLSLIQGIFPTQGSNPGLPNFRQILYQLSHKGSPSLQYNHCLNFEPHLQVSPRIAYISRFCKYFFSPQSHHLFSLFYVLVFLLTLQSTGQMSISPLRHRSRVSISVQNGPYLSEIWFLWSLGSYFISERYLQ